MKFVPENEMGVIVRFAQDIIDLDDISIVSVRVQFPDAILLVNGVEIRTEFEYLASNFISHQHDPRECDLVICWIDDVNHHNKLPTWELSRNEWLSMEIVKTTHSQKEAWYWEARARHAENRIKRLSSRSEIVIKPIEIPTLEELKDDIIAELQQKKPNMSRLATRLNIGRTTLYRHLGTLAEQGEIIKNGNGYEPINSQEL